MYVTIVMNQGSLLVGLMFSFPVTLISQLRAEGYHIDKHTESIIGTGRLLFSRWPFHMIYSDFFFFAGSISMFVSGVGSCFFACIIGKAGRRRIQQVSLVLFIIGMMTIIISKSLITLYIGLVMSSAVTGTLFYFTVPTLKAHNMYHLQTSNELVRLIVHFLSQVFSSQYRPHTWPKYVKRKDAEFWYPAVFFSWAAAAASFTVWTRISPGDKWQFYRSSSPSRLLYKFFSYRKPAIGI